MGYDVHITRKPLWFEEEGAAISLAEWLDYVDSDPEMRLDGYAEAVMPDGVLRVDDESMAIWTAYSGHGVDGNMAWMWHFGGCIVAKNPDEEICVKMHQIAQALGAKVQGDDGEVYGADGTSDEESFTRQPWWKFWR